MSDAQDVARRLVCRFESCRLEAYRDLGRGIATIGWGETNGVKIGDVWSQAEADAQRDARLEQGEARVRAITVGLGSAQVGALISFAYNVGEAELEKSLLLKMIRAKQWGAVARAWLQWDHETVAGKFVESKGLLRRRLAEALTFIEGTP